MVNPLDRPVWSALTGLQSDMAEGRTLARRFRPDINIFAAVGEDTPESLVALSDLVRRNERILLMQKPEPQWDDRLKPLIEDPAFQMVLDALPEKPDSDDILPLTHTDVPDMLALAHLAKPGPFLPLTHTMGQFYGIRIDGRLAAMAGQRHRFSDYCEISGVCTHPDFRGRGLARRLSAHVTHVVTERGETPILHGYAGNAAAIQLYKSLGYKHRADFRATLLERV